MAKIVPVMCPTARHRRLPQRPRRNNLIPCERRSAGESNKEFCSPPLQVHSLYRQTDASFQKAQAEFATGVMSNQAVRQAAVNVAANAAQGSFNAPR